TIKITPQPPVALTSPVQGVQDLAGLPPAPPRRAPQFGATVAVVRHECGELGLGHRGAGDGKRPQRGRVRPLLVVEDERLVRACPEVERPPRDLHVARQRPRATRTPFRLAPRVPPGG